MSDKTIEVAQSDSTADVAEESQTAIDANAHRSLSYSGLRGADLERAVYKATEPSREGDTSKDGAASRLSLPNTWSARDLIKLAEEKPPKPIIEGLLNEGDIMLLHGTEESFKSVMVVQCAEAIAAGKPFLRKWPVHGQRRVGIIETEMHAAMMGQRLKKMFPNGLAPEHIYFMNDLLLKKWRREDMHNKFSIIERWISETKIEVLIIDTANDFFRGGDSTSEEAVVGGFFDELRNLSVDGRIIVRHNRKRRESDESLHPNELIRGSGEWKEDPEAIIHLDRTDKRTNEVEMAVGKLRYGQKPEPCRLWFDSGCFRLTPLSPVLASLEGGPITRQQLVAACQRFGLAERKVDEHIAGLKGYLQESRVGHEKVFSIDPLASKGADWVSYLNEGAARVEDTQS